MGCGCGGSKTNAPSGAPRTAGSGNGPSNPQGSYYWTGPKPGNAPKTPKPKK